MSDRESLTALESGSLPPVEPRFARVVRAIEGQIIPRLLMSSIATERTAHRFEAAIYLCHDDVAKMARLLLSNDAWLAGAFIQEIRRDVPLDRICLELLAPAAREMRELWENKQCDFAEFLTGIKRLLNLLQFVTESATDECSGL